MIIGDDANRKQYAQQKQENEVDYGVLYMQ